MSSKKEYLNKRIRETISSLSDDALINIIQVSHLDYTPFALHVAREELSKRRKMKSPHHDIEALPEIDGANSQPNHIPSNHAGCYIELWRDKNFEGDYLLIRGPAEYETLKAAAEDWGDDIGSLRVGPDALVLTYQDKGFRGEMICFGPCQEVADLSGMRFDDEIDSMKLINSVRIFEDVRQASKQRDSECQ